MKRHKKGGKEKEREHKVEEKYERKGKGKNGLCYPVRKGKGKGMYLLSNEKESSEKGSFVIQ